LGWNYRISGLAAALGISQLQKLESIITEKRRQGSYYSDLQENTAREISLPIDSSNGGVNNYWVYGVVAKTNSLRQELVAKLSQRGIETRPFFHPLSEQPVSKSFDIKKSGDLAVSRMLGECGFYLPTGSHMTREKQELVVSVIA
jgi:perosamine synthetase